MGEGRWRHVRRVCLAAAIVCTALAIGAPARAQDEVTGAPEIWRGSAVASVVALEVNRSALLPVEDLFRFIALHGVSTYETDLQLARASLFYPGEGLIQGPNLACGTFGSSFPPELKPLIDACLTYDYPLTVKADASGADTSTAGAVTLGKPTDAVSADAIGAKAHAAADGASTVAVMEHLRVQGLPGIGAVSLLPLEQLALDPTVVSIDSATSHTTQRIDDSGRLVVSAESTVSGVRLVGGLIEIASIRSVSSATDNAAGTRTADASIEVAGITVGGVPAQITDEGLVVGTPAGGAGPLAQQLQGAVNELVQALNVRVTLLDTEETTDDGTGLARAGAGGVLVEIALNVDGAPSIPGPLGDIDLNGTYEGSVLLGSSGATAGAQDFATDDTTPVDPGLSSVGGDGAFDVGPPSFDAVGAPPPTERTATPSPQGPAEVVRRIADTFGGRLGLLYLAFMCCVLGLCTAPGLTLPARFPGPRT